MGGCCSCCRCGKACGARKNNCLHQKKARVSNGARTPSEGKNGSNLDVLWEPLHLSQEIYVKGLNRTQPTSSDEAHCTKLKTTTNEKEFSTQEKAQEIKTTSTLVPSSRETEAKHQRRRHKRFRNDANGHQHMSAKAPCANLPLTVDVILNKTNLTDRNAVTVLSNGQADSSNQLLHVYRLFETHPPNLSEVRMALPSVKALICDQTLVERGSFDFIQPISNLISRLQRASETCSPEETFELTVLEKKALVAALQAAKLLPAQDGMLQRMIEVNNKKPNGDLDTSDFHHHDAQQNQQKEQQQQPKDQCARFDAEQTKKEVGSLVDLLLDVASGNQINRDTFNQIKQHVAGLIDPKDNSKSPLVTELIAAPTLVRDLERFTNRMDQAFAQTNDLQLNMQMHNLIGDLVTRLNPLITSFDSQSIEFGLQTLYDAAIVPEAFQTHQVTLDHFTSTAVLRALEQAVRDHRLNPKSTNASGTSPKNLWSVASHLINRLSNDLVQEPSEDSIQCTALDPKEGILVQHILLSALSNHGIERTVEEKETDSAFFQFCSRRPDTQQSSLNKNGRLYGSRSPELLSPISELCTPDTSTYDTENTLPEAGTTSTRIQAHATPHSSLRPLDQHILSDERVEHSNTSDSLTTVRTLSVVEPIPAVTKGVQLNENLRIALADQEPEPVVRTPVTSKTPAVIIPRSTARQLATYLRSKLLDNITLRISEPKSPVVSESIERLSSVIDQNLMKMTTEDQITLSIQDAQTLEAVLIADETPYARILRRSLEPNFVHLTKPMVSTELVEPFAPVHQFTGQPEKISDSDRSEVLHRQIMSIAQQTGQYISVDEVEQLASGILQYSKTNRQSIPILQELIEMAHSWSQNPRPVLITEMMANQLKHAATLLCSESNRSGLVPLSDEPNEAKEATVYKVFPTPSAEAESKITRLIKAPDNKQKGSFTRTTGAVEVIKSLAIAGIDWSQCSHTDRKRITGCVQLLYDTYPELNFPDHINEKDLPKVWPLVTREIDRLPDVKTYSQRWNQITQLLAKHAKMEHAKIQNDSIAAHLADAVNASVVKLISQPSACIKPTQATAALNLAQRLIQAAQTKNAITLQSSEQELLGRLYNKIAKDKFSSQEPALTNQGNLPILQNLLCELTDSQQINGSSEIHVLPTTCATLLAFLPAYASSPENQTNLVLLRSQLLQSLSGDVDKTEKSTVENWKRVIDKLVSHDKSPKESGEQWEKTVDILTTGQYSVSPESVRTALVKSLDQQLSTVSLAPKQLIRLARTVQILREDLPLNRTQIDNIVDEVNKIRLDADACVEDDSLDRVCLAATNLSALLAVERSMDENGLVSIDARDCAQLWESAQLILQPGVVQPNESFDNQLCQAFKQQMFVGAVSGEGWSLSPAVIGQLSSQISHIKSTLKAVQEQEQQKQLCHLPIETLISPETLKSVVKSHLQRYILNHPISFQAWHCIRELVNLLSDSTLNRNSQQAQNQLQAILARLFIYAEESELFDTTQKSIAIAYLNMMEMWLADRNEHEGTWTLTDGYTLAFVLSQLAWRMRGRDQEPDQEVVALVTQLLTKMNETSQLIADADTRYRLLRVVRTQITQLRPKLLSSMDPKIWSHLIETKTDTNTDAALRMQQAVALIALIASVLNLPVKNTETALPLSKQCANLVTWVLKVMQSYDLAMNRVDLEHLYELLEQRSECGQSEKQHNLSHTGLLNVLEGIETVSHIINAGMIHDRAEALTLFSQLVSLEQLAEQIEPFLEQDIMVVKNLLGCLLASSSDVFPFPMEPNLTASLQKFADHVRTAALQPIKHVISDGLTCLQTSLQQTTESGQVERAQFVRTSTPVSGSSQTENDEQHEEAKIVLIPSQHNQIARALSLVLACGHTLSPTQTRTSSDMLLRLQSTDNTPLVLTSAELVSVGDLLNSVLHADLPNERHVPSGQIDQVTMADESSVVEYIPLTTEPVLLPADALDLSSSLTLALQQPQVVQDLSQSEKRSIAAVRRRLLFAAVRGQSIDISSVQPLIQRISELLCSDQRDSETNMVIRRLETLARPNFVSGEVALSSVQHVDPETAELLHQCLHEQLRIRPTTLATTLPVMSIITELEAANEPPTSMEYLNDEFPQAYSSFALSPTELRTVTNFLRTGSSANTGQMSGDSLSIQPSEQITALLLVRNAADGEPIWPSESRLLLSALETLAVSNPSAARFITDELAGLKSRLLSSADLEESVQNLYEGSGFTPTELELAQLRTLCSIVAPGIDDRIQQLVTSVRSETNQFRSSRVLKLDREQISELCRIFLLHLCHKPIPQLHELALMNRVACGLSSELSSPESLALLGTVCATPIRFTETPTEATDSIAVKQTIRSVPAFVPDLLEQALGQGEAQLSFKPIGSLLLSNILNFLALLDFQPGCDRLLPKWSSHLKRLALQILYSGILNHSVRLDVRSRALLSIAYKYYRSNLTDVSQDMVDAADETLHGKTALHELDMKDRSTVAECLCVALASPMRYNLSPVRAGFIASLAEALQAPERQVTFDALDMQLVCETVHSLSDLENKVRECPSDTFTLLSCLQTIEQFLELHEQSGKEGTVFTRRDAAVVGAALEVLMNVAHEEPRFDSWDSDDPTTISQDCRSSLGLTQCFLSSLTIGANLPGPAQQIAVLTPIEISHIKQLVNYWKPRLLLDAQRQRTSSIRKLSVSTECDLTADITNQQLANAVQLTVIHGRIAQPQDAWLCIQTLEQLVRSPANDYISISNSQRDALRLAMCPVRSSALPSQSLSGSSPTVHLPDANLFACMTYLHRILTASTTSTFGHRTRFCVQPADVAAFATSLRTLLDTFVGDLTHKEAFAVLRVMEQRMRCTAASLEAYWITQPESRAIREVLRYLYTNTGNTAANQLASLIGRLEKSVMSKQNGSRTIELIAQEQSQLLQALRTYILLVPDALPMDYGKLIELIDYLMYARPASLTENHLTLLQDLSRLDLPQLAIQSQRSTSSELRFTAVRSSLNHLTGQNRTATSTLVPTSLCVHPREAASLFCVLNALNACAKCVDPSLILIQSALAHCVANGQIWTTWSALPPNSKLRVRQALGNCVDDLVERLIETHALSWSPREWASLELARDNMLRLLELQDNVLLSEGLHKLRLVSLLIPGEKSSEHQSTVKRPLNITRFHPITGEMPDVEEPDSGSLLDAIQCLQMSIFCDNVLVSSEDCLESLKSVHVLRSAANTLQLTAQDQLLLQELESILFDLAARSVKEGSSGHSVRTELRASRELPFTKLENLLERIKTQWTVNEANDDDKHTDDPDTLKLLHHEVTELDTSKALSCDMLESGPLSTSSAVELGQPMEGVHRALGRFLTLCNTRILQPEEITELTASVDMLYRATNQLTSRLRGYAQFSPIERNVLRNLQLATERNRGYTLSPESADILQALGQRLSSLALQANQDLLRNGLELWLTASVDGRFVFDDRETQQLHSALCLARDTLRKDQLRAASDDALGIVDKVIEQFSSTVDSGIGTEITGPHCLGPAVTEVLEGAQRAHEAMSLPGSTMSGAPSSSSDWCINHHRADGLQRQNRICTEPESNATDEDGASDQLDTDMVRALAKDTCSIAKDETELSRAFTSNENMSALTEKLSGDKLLQSRRKLEDREVNRRHTIGQPVTEALATEKQRSYALSPTFFASIAEEQRRLKTWETLIEARLNHACKRVESLLDALPKPDSTSDAAVEVSLSEKNEEVNQLRDEVLKLKQQLVEIVGQLESAERMQQRQAQFASSMRELMENQRQLRLHLLSERAGLFSADTSRKDQVTTEPDTDHVTRLYRSSDCIKELSPTTVIHPHHSQVVLYKPIESESLDLSLSSGTQHRFSSLDRLHELIEIRRAVVAGSREELCRLGVYSSLPLRLGRIPPFQRPLLPLTSEGDEKPTVKTETPSGPRLLHRLLERQRNYTKHLLGRASYEQDQSSRVLDALEERLNNLEHQVTSSDRTVSTRPSKAPT